MKKVKALSVPLTLNQERRREKILQTLSEILPILEKMVEECPLASYGRFKEYEHGVEKLRLAVKMFTVNKKRYDLNIKQFLFTDIQRAVLEKENIEDLQSFLVRSFHQLQKAFKEAGSDIPIVLELLHPRYNQIENVTHKKQHHWYSPIFGPWIEENNDQAFQTG